MKIFLFQSNQTPNLFIKAKTQAEAMSLFEEGFFDAIELDSITAHLSFQVRELTIDILLETAPDEFTLDEHASF